MGHAHKLLGVVAVAAALELGGQASDAHAEMAVGPELTVSGQIAFIDPVRNMVKLESGAFVSNQFVIDSDTKITDGRQPLGIEQIQPGAKATVEYVQKEQHRVAESITIKSTEAEPAAPPLNSGGVLQPAGVIEQTGAARRSIDSSA